jgi:hypothetical protein
MRKAYLASGSAVAVLLGVTLPLYSEFFEPGLTLWNSFLVLTLIGLVVAALLLARFFAAHAGEIGEARFDTRNKSDVHG